MSWPTCMTVCRMRRRTTMKLPRQPAAVVFDMDGLLFDTEKHL